MQFPDTVPDSETQSLLSRVFDEAWRQTQEILIVEPLDPSSVRNLLAKRIMAAANRGERDPARLKLLALHAIDS